MRGPLRSLRPWAACVLAFLVSGQPAWAEKHCSLPDPSSFDFSQLIAEHFSHPELYTIKGAMSEVSTHPPSWKCAPIPRTNSVPIKQPC